MSSTKPNLNHERHRLVHRLVHYYQHAPLPLGWLRQRTTQAHLKEMLRSLTVIVYNGPTSIKGEKSLQLRVSTGDFFFTLRNMISSII